MASVYSEVCDEAESNCFCSTGFGCACKLGFELETNEEGTNESACVGMSYIVPL